MTDKCRVHPDKGATWQAGELCTACESRLRVAQRRIDNGLSITPTQAETVRGLGRWPEAVRARFDEAGLRAAKVELPTKRKKQRGRTEYGLRRTTGMTWQQIADRCGFSNQNDAITAAKVYAQRNDLVWPPRQPTDKGARAYTLRTQGKRWQQIAYDLDFRSYSSAIRAAHTYAQRHDLQWPIELGEE